MKHGSKFIRTIAAVLAVALFATVGSSFLVTNRLRADSGTGWEFEDGTLTITDSSAFEAQVPEWDTYRHQITELVVESGIETIPSRKFNEYYYLTTVTLKDVQSIKDHAFTSCKALKTISMPKVTSIGDLAFLGCAFETVELPQNSVEIGESTFQQCTSLTSINLENASKIGAGAFSYCSQLKKADLSNVTFLGESAFKECPVLETLTLGSGITEIPESAFSHCVKLTSVDLSKVTSVGEGAFYYCINLKSVTLGNNTTTISDSAFSQSGLETIDLKNVTSLGNNCFKECDFLETVILGSDLKVIPYQAFSMCYNLKNIDLSNVKIFGASAFYSCYALSDVDLSSAEQIGDSAFQQCTGLTSVDLRTVTILSDYAFYYDSELTEISLSNKIQYCGDYAFRGTALDTVDFIGTKSEFESLIPWGYFSSAEVSYSAYDVWFELGIDDHYGERQAVNAGEKVVRPEDPSKDGVAFTGWYTDTTCQTPFDFDTPINKDTKIYAGWIGKLDDSAVAFKGHSLSLEGDIGVKFYLEIPNGTSNSAYVKFTVQDNSQSEIFLVKDAPSVIIDGVTYKVFKCGVPAKNMTSVIHADLIDNGEILASDEYTVQEYAKYILDHQTQYDPLLVSLVKDLLDYGSAAQVYFKCNTDNLANEIMEEKWRYRYFNFSGYDYDPDEDCKLPSGMTFSAVNLSLKSNTVMKMYFTDSSNRNVKFYYNGKELEQQDSKGRTMIQIPGISAHMIRDEFVVTVKVEGDDTEYFVKYCPTTYCNIILGTESVGGDAHNLVRLYYLYSMSAENYICVDKDY